MNTIYLKKDDTHIKIVQTDPDMPIYIRAHDGREMLCPNQVFCELIEKFANINEWKGIGDK